MTATTPSQSLSGLDLVATGKVRELYSIGTDRLLCVTSDRISAYDVILPTPITDKGKVLTQLSAWWFQHLGDHCANHLLTTDIDAMPSEVQAHREWLTGRTMLVERVEIFPVECVVRGYLSGSGWKSYGDEGSVCGVPLPRGLRESEKLPEPIFTPTTKATEGHDESISFAQMTDTVGAADANALRELSLALYCAASEHAREQGIIIADTKFEFGRRADGTIVLADEVLTPDSSRFWPASAYEAGRGQPSFDKQYVRDHLDSIGWSRQPPAPELPGEVVEGTRLRYLEAFTLITGENLA